MPRHSPSSLRLRWPFGRIETYVLKRCLTAVAGALGIIAAVILLVQFVDVSREVGARAEISPLQVLYLTVLKAPSVILLLFPFAFLFGTLAAFVDLNRRSELVALRAAGVSAWRFIFPAAAAAATAGAVTVTLLNPLASGLNARYEREQARLVYNVKIERAADVWLRQGDGRSQIVIHARSRPGPTRLMDVSMFVYMAGPDGRFEFSRLIESRSAFLHKGYWQLVGAREAGPGQKAIAYETLSIPSNLNPATAFDRFSAPQSIPFWSLGAAIARIEAAGFSATGYRLRLQELLATPLLFAAMSILGAAFSLRLMRLGGLAVLASSGVALGFVFFFFNQLCVALGKGEVIPPLLAAWTPPLLAVLSGFTLLCYTEDG